MKDLIKKCTEHLIIQKVTLKNFYVSLCDDIDAENFDNDLLDNSQDLKATRCIREFTSDSEPNDDYSYKINVLLGLRLLSQEDWEKDTSDDEIEPVLEFRAEFVALYNSDCQLSQDEMNEFSKKHVYYHVWPYWRELIQSTCGRLELPTISIPALRV